MFYWQLKSTSHKLHPCKVHIHISFFPMPTMSGLLWQLWLVETWSCPGPHTCATEQTACMKLFDWLLWCSRMSKGR